MKIRLSRVTIVNLCLFITVAAAAGVGAYIEGSTASLARPGVEGGENRNAPDISQAQLVLFYSGTCDACTSARQFLHASLSNKPDIDYQEVEITMKGADAKREAVNHRLQVPQTQYSSVPALYTRSHYYVGLTAIQKNLPVVLEDLESSNRLSRDTRIHL